MPVMSPQHRATAQVSTTRAAGVILGWLVLMWFLESVDMVVPALGLDSWGVSPRDVGELPQIFVAPFIHYGFDHLVANSVPFLVLGFLIILSGMRPFILATLAATLGSGLLVWLASPAGSVTAGASGVIFGWLTFVLARGFFTRNWVHLLIGVVVFAVYGGILWGVLPAEEGVSWQGHLGGAVGGLLAARWMAPTRVRAPQPTTSYPGTPQ